MKLRLFSYSLFSAFFTVASMAQSIKTVQIEFSENDFVFSESERGLDVKTTAYFITYPSNEKEPALPQILKYIELDNEMEYENFKYSSTKKVIRNNCKINNNNITLPPSLNKCNDTDKEVDFHGSANLFNKRIVEFTGIHSIDGKKYASFLISPFEYDSELKILYFYTTFSLEIIQKNIQNARIANDGKISKKQIRTSTNDFPTLNDAYCKYLIITNDSLKPAFQKLAEWKNTKGVPTKILTTEEIYNENVSGTQQIKIKTAIRNIWLLNNRHIEYVLLGGDINIVPTQMCYIKHVLTTYTGSIRTFESYTPTDWFYGCIDTGTITWDTNGNGKAGETEDNVDLTAELVVSRMPVHSSEEALCLINRTIDYERNPLIGNWVNKMLIGGRCYDPGMYENGLSDAHRLGEDLYNYGVAPYWEGDKFRFFDTGTDMPEGTDYKFIAENLQEQISRGYPFIHIETHGKEHGLLVENSIPSPSAPDQFYDTIYASTVNNPKKTILTTSACFTNAFDYENGDCFSEAIIKNPQSGILAYIGNSRESWLTNGYTTSTIQRHIYQKMFSGIWHCLGKAFKDSKNEIVGCCNTYTTSWRWMLFSLNMLGDPETPVYISSPQTDFNDLSLYYPFENEFAIRTEEPYARICFMSKKDGGNSFFYNECNDFPISDFMDELSFCVTAPNHVPFIGVYAPTVHLQNEIIGWNYHIIGRKAVTGLQITNAWNSGPFIIEKGKTSFYTPQGATIQNGFEVKLGAELEINVNNP